MRSIVIAPHPDDEVLGVGGTLLRRKAEGAKIAWVIVTNISTQYGWSEDQVKQRENEILAINNIYDFDSIFELKLPTTKLDQIPIKQIIELISETFKAFEPTEVFLPHFSDIHSDHRIIAEAAMSCVKWFRYPTIKRVLAYETLSETDSNLKRGQSFSPNFYVNIEKYLDKKLSSMYIYQTETGNFPFPRSEQAIQALARLRGASSGFMAAEAFELLRETI